MNLFNKLFMKLSLGAAKETKQQIEKQNTEAQKRRENAIREIQSKIDIPEVKNSEIIETKPVTVVQETNVTETVSVITHNAEPKPVTVVPKIIEKEPVIAVPEVIVTQTVPVINKKTDEMLRENIKFKTPDILRPVHFTVEPQDIPVVCLSSEEAIEKGYSFRKSSKSVKITGFHGKASEKLVIPCSIDSLPVEEICPKVFMEAELNELFIPATIRKLGTEVFKRSTVTKVFFGDGLSSISEKAFNDCYSLEQVILPATLRHIGKAAFCGCRKLTYIGFPKKVSQIEDGAFSYSGLESFSVEIEHNRITNSKAFYHTPMYNKHDIISTSMLSNKLMVLYVNNKTALKLTADRIHFLPYSLDHRFCLDLTECKEISFNRMAVPRTEFSSAQNGYILKLPVESRRDFTSFFPDYVEIYDSLGKTISHDIYRVTDPYDPEYYDEWEIPEDRPYDYEYNINYGFLPRFGLRTDHKRIYVDSYDIAENAIDSSALEEIEFYMFNPEGCVFTKNCVNLRKVSWGDGRTTITKYLPPCELVDKYLKIALLNAFSSCSGPYGRSRIPGLPGHRRTVFNREVIDSIFRERKVCARDNPYIKRAVPSWFAEDKTITVSNKFKALVAVDVLRSDKMPHESDTKMYSDFLKSHRSFCHKYFEIISDEFPEYAAALKEIEQE
jgi:hypothetical protein